MKLIIPITETQRLIIPTKPTFNVVLTDNSLFIHKGEQNFGLLRINNKLQYNSQNIITANDTTTTIAIIKLMRNVISNTDIIQCHNILTKCCETANTYKALYNRLKSCTNIPV